MANVWMHNGFLQVEGQKMSKSLGNFVTINELLATEKFGGRKWPGEVLRLAMLMTHYREPIDFSVARLEEAQTTRLDWIRAARRWRPEEGTVSLDVISALNDDLDTATVKMAIGASWLGDRGVMPLRIMQRQVPTSVRRYFGWGLSESRNLLRPRMTDQRLQPALIRRGKLLIRLLNSLRRTCLLKIFWAFYGSRSDTGGQFYD